MLCSCCAALHCHEVSGQNVHSPIILCGAKLPTRWSKDRSAVCRCLARSQ